MSRYVLKDGREFRALEDWEIRAAEREAQRRQLVADIQLEHKLAVLRSQTLVLAVLPPGQTGDLFGGS